MNLLGYGIAFLIGALLGAIAMFLTLKDTDIIRGYEIRISALEADNAILKAKANLERAKADLEIDDKEYHPENMEKKTVKEIKYGGF